MIKKCRLTPEDVDRIIQGYIHLYESYFYPVSASIDGAQKSNTFHIIVNNNPASSGWVSALYLHRRTLQLILRRHEFQPLEIGLGLEMTY